MFTSEGIVLAERELHLCECLSVLVNIVSMSLAGTVLVTFRDESNKFVLCHNGETIAEHASQVKALQQ